MFKNKFLERVITIVFLVIHTTEILASALILDPNSKHNAKLDKSETGIPIINISTPNNRGISVNEFLEYNVGKEGQVLNNADNVGRSHLAGLINSNPNLGPHQAANLIVLQVNGSNRSQIEGYLEALSRQKVNVILSNENGIYLNNSGTINIKNFTATTGKVKLKDGDFIGIDVEKGNIAIGPKGMDLTKADYVELLSKTLELTGNLVAEKDMRIVTGSNKFDKDGNFEKIESSSPASIAIDASNLGGMYANTIKIISTDKGAGVNSNAFIVSKNNKLEITADGKVKVNKIQGKGIDVKAKDYEQTELAHSNLDINIKADSIKLSGSGTQAEQKIILDGNVENNSAIYTKENLYTKDLKNTSDIQVLKDIQVDGKLVSSGDIQANDKILIASSANNTGNISTGSTFTAKDTKTKGKLITKDSIDVKNLTNEGTIATEAKLNIDGNLKSSAEIKAIGNIQVASNAENTGDILTDGSFSAKDTKTTKKLLAKEQITVANLENSGELGTNSSLTVDGKLENKGKIQVVDKIDVSSSAKNEGEILTNSTFTAKDVNTSNKLIALGDISTSNLINSGKLATQGNLGIDGALTNSDEIQVAKNISVALNAENTGDILTDGSFSAKDTKTTKKLLAKEQITVANLENSGELGTNSSLTVDGKLENKGKIQVVDKIDVSSSAKNEGEILTNSTFTAKDVDTSNKLIALGDISTSNLINSGKLATQENLTVDGALTNSDEIQVAKNISVASNAENTGDILADGSFSAKDTKTTKKLLAKEQITVANLENSGELGTNSSLTIDGKLENRGKIQVVDKIDVSSSAKNEGEILTNSTFTAKDVNTSNKLIALGDISTSNLINSGKLVTQGNLSIDGVLTNSDEIQVAKNITVASNVENTGDILTDGSFSAKDTKTTKKLLAKEQITVANLENSGELGTNSSLTVDGKLENKGKIQVVDKIDVSSSAKNEGEILTNSTFTAKDVDTSNKLIALGDVSTSNLINSGKLATQGNLTVDGALTNSDEIQVAKNISVASNAENTGDILTDGSFSAKDTKTSKILVAKDSINIGSLTNDGLVATDSNLNIKGKLVNTKDIKANREITVLLSADNGGEILTNSTFTAKDTTNTKKLIAVDKISVANLKNDGALATNSTLTVDGTLKNTKNIQAAEAINVSSSADNSGIILTNSTFTAKDTTNTKKIVAKDNIKTDSLLNTDTIATDGSLTVVGDLKNSGDINVVKEITVDKNAENTGIILTNSSFSAKDTKTTNKLVAIGEITTKNLINEGELATKSKLNIDGTLENKKNTQAVDNITISSNVKNDGTILTDANFSSKDIINTKTLIARENISSGTLDNSGVFSAGKNLTVNGSVNNSKTIEATNIDIIGASLTNTSSIKADNIVASVNSTKNDGEILALNDITLNTKKLDNTKKIGALRNITANNTVLTNSGEIVSNNKIELNNSDINNSNNILSNTIEMKNATNFNNTGTIKGTDVTLTTKKDINLVANLHGENSLIIEGNNIINNGNTTGKNLISIKSNNFTNKKELSSKNLKINAGEDVLNENVISAEIIKINANNLTNNDLIAAEKDLNITTKNKVINSKNHTIYAGDQLNIKASEILNDTAEILGNNVRLEANHILNHTGTLQALNNMYIKSSKFENIGEVEDLDKYESYYETWDGQIIEANQIEEWKIHFSESSSKRTSGSAGSTISRRQRREFNNMVEKINSNKYKALLFPKYTEIMRNKLGQNGYYTEKTGSAKNPEIPLKEKLRSLGKTTHAKILAGNNILIEKNSDSNNEVINKDGIISAENIVKIDANKVENLVSVGDEKIKVKTGQETFFMKREKTGKRYKKKVRMEVTYTRDFADDYITKRVQKLDENGNPVYRRGLGRKRPVYINVTEYVGRYAYVTGQPSVIEGKKVLIDSASLVKQDIEEANGYIKNRNDVVIQDFSNKTFNTGISNINQNFNFDSTKTNISKIDIKDPLDNISTGLSDIQNPVTSVNNDLKIDDKLNEKDNITDLTSENVKIDTSTLDNQEKIQNIDTNTKKIEFFSNMDSIKEILRSGKIDTLPNLPSSLFIKNLEPTDKYVMETRLKHISLSSYYGSDYFLNKVGYEEKWDRVKRLGDAFYENQLIERSIIEKLGTRFLNGTAISMKQLIDNATIEAPKLNLVIGQALTKEQISSLDKDIVWYEYQDVSGLKVLAPKVYLSKNTMANIKADGRSRIEGTELTSIKAKNVDNAGLIGNKGTTYIEADSITNRSIGDQIAEITGDKTTLVAENDIFNIGSKISATDELNLISKNGNILNQSTITETNRNYGDLNRTRHTELENIAEISSNNKLNIIADNYTSIAAKTNAKELDIAVKEDVNISSQKLSGEQKFGKDGSNFNAYAFESNIGSNVNAENINIDAKNLNITGSAVLAKNANLAMNKLNIDSNVDKIDTESRFKSKGFLSSKSKVEMQHSETNVAGTLYIEDKATINGDVNVVGSNLVLGKDSYVDGSLTTDSKATYNKYILEEKKKGFSFDLSSSSFNLSYGKNQFNYDEKDKTNIKSNLVLGDGTVLNKGAEITATNFSHGDIEVNNGDVVYGARKDERDVKISTKSSSFGISANVSSPALERIKQGANALEQIGNGDALGGLVNVGNAITGTVDGLASNIKTKDGKQATAEDVKDNKFTSNNSFYMQAGVSAGYSKSKQESKSHNEKAVVTNITGLDENAKITYNDNKNVKYQGTQASDTTFVYNNVENVTKEAVELNNYYKSKGSSSGIGVSVGITDSEPSISLNVNASKNKLNTDETVYQNGSFVDVNEVHNNTKNMQLSGFTQTGGKVTGNIENLNIESKQNTSKTKGDTKGTNLGVNLLTGTPTGNISASRTDGDRNFVDNQTTFVVGENSNLKIGNVDNTASIIGTTDNGKISIENYTGRNLENSDKLTTVGGSVGTSGVGISYSNSEKEGITRNTVVGNVEIEKSSGDTINRDLSKANEITKNSSTSTNVYAESQLVNAVQNPNEFKERAEVAKIEINSLGNSISKSIDNILNGDKSQDIGDPEKRTLREIKETVIRVQTAPEMDLIAKEKDFSSKETLDKLGINAIEKFDVNSSELPEGVKARKEELNTENKELVAFYDETTNKIFISKDIKDKTEIRALIAREWKISEDLKDKKGKSNDKDELRATVAGEIAYEEIKNRAKKGETEEFDISKLNNAVMDKDTVVTSDRYFNKTRGEIERQIAIVNYYYNVINNENARAETIGKDEEFDKNNLEYKAEYEKKLANINKIVQISELEEHYRIIEIPRLEEKLSTVKDKSEKKALESRLNLLKDERDTLEGFIRSNNLINKNLVKGLSEGGTKGLIKGAIFEVGSKITNIASSALMFLTLSTELNKDEDRTLYTLKPISKEEAKYIGENFPEYYYAHRIGERIEEKQIFWNKEKRNVSIAEFYKNSKGILAKEIGSSIGEVAGFTVGRIATDKGINTVNKLVNQSGITKATNTILPATINEKTSFISNNDSVTNDQKLLPVSTNREIIKPDFYVGPSGASSTLPSTAYRYMDSKWYDTTKETMSGPLSYFGFEKFDNAYQVRDRYQIAYDYYNLNNITRTWSDASVRGTFDTLQLYNNKGIPSVRIPKIYGDTGKELEPFTISYPEHGQGGAFQLKPIEPNRIIKYDKLDILNNPRTDMIIKEGGN